MGGCVRRLSGEIGGSIKFPIEFMAENTIERGYVKCVSRFRASTELVQLGNAVSGLDWVWQRESPKVD